MKEQLLSAWRLNNSKNLLLLNNIGEEQLAVAPPTKGRTVGEQMGHLHNVRMSWTEHVAKSIYDASLLVSKDTALSVALLSNAFASSAEKIAQVIEASWEKEGKLPAFKTGLIPFVSYLISHESHHRGNILLTLKQSGFKIPDKLKWGLWEWDKPLS